MKIINFRVKTRKGELVKLEEVSSLSFGIMVDDHFNAETKKLFITCKQGNLSFPLDEVGEISFKLDKEKSYVDIGSRFCVKDEENGKI